jgi:uncharacterized phage protein (TIGR02218 family)
MKPLSDPLKALLATRQFYTVKLFTFTLFDGTVASYCAGDHDVVWNSTTYSCGGSTGPYFERTDKKAKTHLKIGMDVDNLTFDVLPGSGTIERLPFLQAMRWGYFDGADLFYQRAYAPNGSSAITGALPMFKGRVADISFGRSILTFTINSYLELLNQNIPRNLFQAGCVNTLYDASCALDPNAFNDTSIAGAGSTAKMLLANFARADDYYDLGKVTMTGGALNGLSRPVRKWTAGQGGNMGAILLGVPFPAAPMAGDTFKVFAGCDKQQTTCASKFSNIVNFRGTPYVPVPEVAS